jgi:hypothetical protein
LESGSTLLGVGHDAFWMCSSLSVVYLPPSFERIPQEYRERLKMIVPGARLKRASLSPPVPQTAQKPATTHRALPPSRRPPR